MPGTEALMMELMEMGRRAVGENAAAILEHTIRKCKTYGKGPEYLPVLFENELSDFQMREAVNAIGRWNYEQRTNAGAKTGPA